MPVPGKGDVSYAKAVLLLGARAVLQVRVHPVRVLQAETMLLSEAVDSVPAGAVQSIPRNREDNGGGNY